MDEKKAEYVAVPTTDYQHPPTPAPAPCSHCTNGAQPCRRRRFCYVKALLIGGAVALLTYNAVSHWTSSSQHTNEVTLEHASSPFDVKHPVGNFGYPKDAPAYEQVDELADFMSSLQTTLAPHHKPQFAPECCPPPHPPHPTTKDVKKGDHHKHKKHHHKHHHHKHQHQQRDMENLPNFEHRHRRTPMPRRDQHHHDEPKGCPCAAPPPPPPPPPPSDVKKEEHHLIQRFQGPPHSFCPPDVELNATSTVYSFSPEEFNRAALYIGHGFVDSGDVYFTKSGNKNINDIKVKVTVLHGSDEARDKVTLSAFDHDGQYVVEMRRDLPRHPFKKQDNEVPPRVPGVPGSFCVKYKVEIILPAALESFEEFDLRAKDAHVGSCKGLQTVVFDRFIAGVGRGYLNFGGLNAQFAKLGVLSGHIRGNYSASKKLAAGVLHGTTEFTAKPIVEDTRITSIVGRGQASVKVPANVYEGGFVVHSSHQGTPAVQAPNPKDLHITKYRHDLKKGYYKTEDTGSFIVVHNRHGETKLTFA